MNPDQSPFSVDRVLNEKLAHSFEAQKWTLAIAESCTGGGASAHLCAQAGVSSLFLGGIICYSAEVKKNLLQVPSAILQNQGAVSEACAKALASGVKKLLLSDWAISITGFAGPSGGSATEPVGSVWFAVCGPSFEASINQRFSGDRNQIQNSATRYALQFLLSSVISQSP